MKNSYAPNIFLAHGMYLKRQRSHFYLRSTPSLIREDNELDKNEEESAREKEKRLFQKMLSKCESSLERMFQS